MKPLLVFIVLTIIPAIAVLAQDKDYYIKRNHSVTPVSKLKEHGVSPIIL